MYLVDALPDFQQCKAFCDGTQENRNLVSVTDGVIIDCYKGLPDEMNNALLRTHSLHPQNGECPVTTAVKRIVPLKVVRALRVVLSLCSRSEKRPQIKAALKSQNFAERRNVLASLDFTDVELSSDAAKAIAFQLAQTIALIDGREIYTKQEVKDFSPSLQPMIDRQFIDGQILNQHRDRLIEQLGGVYVRQKDALNVFCYENGPAIKEWNQFASQCRGIIIDLKAERCVCYPFDKFFQIDEVPWTELSQLPSDLPAETVEKVDGSMVTCFPYNGAIEFHCKGNFDVEQSKRATEISSRYKMDRLDFDRHWHVFEVIYPGNRFPDGLCVTDYGDREEIILTGLRDRRTNEMLPYEYVVAEAQRVELPHPRVFHGSFDDAVQITSQEESELGEEGFVTRFENGLYVKVKYPAYKQVLRFVNDLKSTRFVKRYVSFNKDERQTTLAILPESYRAVADQHLREFRDVAASIEGYFASVVEQHEPEFPEYILQNVPQEFHKPLFGFWRGQDYSDVLEKLALKIYLGKLEIPVRW